MHGDESNRQAGLAAQTWLAVDELFGTTAPARCGLVPSLKRHRGLCLMNQRKTLI